LRLIDTICGFSELISWIKPLTTVNKPTDGKGALPTFAQADVNSDHYVTKDELKNSLIYCRFSIRLMPAKMVSSNNMNTKTWKWKPSGKAKNPKSI
jgi:hypothetical protein